MVRRCEKMTWIEVILVVVAVLVAAVALLGASCVAPHAPKPGDVAPDIILVRGLGDRLTDAGLDVLADRLAGRGKLVRVIPYTEGFVMSQLLVRDGKRPHAIIGHSLGSDTALEIAGNLASAHIGVENLVLLDGTHRGIVPENVQRAVHFCMQPVTPDLYDCPRIDGAETRLVGPGGTDPELRGINHVTMDDSAVLQDRVISIVFPGG